VLLALMAGGIFIDQLYARSMPQPGGPAAHGAADALLLLALPVAGLGIAAAALRRGRARTLLVLSLGLFAMEFVLPALVRTLPGGRWLTMVGPQLRTGAVLTALLLAILAAIPAREVQP
jgi:hypothetical protein